MLVRSRGGGLIFGSWVLVLIYFFVWFKWKNTKILD